MESNGRSIRTDELTKIYGRVTCAAGVSLEVRPGEVYGLLGPNGSGKTTTIRVLLGLLKPTAGGAKVGEFDCWRDSLDVRRVVAYLPGELRMYGSMTGYHTLKMLSDLRDGVGLDRAVAIAERVMNLDLYRKVRTYSTGMKQKLALAQVFGDPVEILILDEPTSAWILRRGHRAGTDSGGEVTGPDGGFFGARSFRGGAGSRSGGDHAEGPVDARRRHAAAPRSADAARAV